MRYDCTSSTKASLSALINQFPWGRGAIQNRNRSRISRRARATKILTSAQQRRPAFDRHMTDSCRQYHVGIIRRTRKYFSTCCPSIAVTGCLQILQWINR